jgi:hypothetical protein
MRIMNFLILVDVRAHGPMPEKVASLVSPARTGVKPGALAKMMTSPGQGRAYLMAAGVCG